MLPGERDVLAPAHPAVGDEEDLQLSPPHPGQRGSRGRQLVHRGDGWDLVLGDSPVGLPPNMRHRLGDRRLESDGMTERLALVLNELDVGFGRIRHWR